MIAAAGVLAQEVEGLVGAALEPFGEHPLRLLDDNATGEGALELFDEQLLLAARSLLQQSDGCHVREGASGLASSSSPGALRDRFIAPIRSARRRIGSASTAENPRRCSAGASRGHRRRVLRELIAAHPGGVPPYGRSHPLLAEGSSYAPLQTPAEAIPERFAGRHVVGPRPEGVERACALGQSVGGLLTDGCLTARDRRTGSRGLPKLFPPASRGRRHVRCAIRGNGCVGWLDAGRGRVRPG